MGRLSDAQLAAWRAFISAQAAVVDRIERALAAEGRIPLSSYDVLLALYESPGRRARMHELARRVVMSRSGLSRLVDRLERDGLLARERSSTDRRGAYAVLTDRGLTALRRAWPVYARGIRTYFAAQLTDDEVRVLTAALRRVDDAVRRQPRPEEAPPAEPLAEDLQPGRLSHDDLPP